MNVQLRKHQLGAINSVKKHFELNENCINLKKYSQCFIFLGKIEA